MAPKAAPDPNKTDKAPNSKTGAKDISRATVVPKGNT